MLNKNKQFEVSSDVKEYIDIVQRKQSKHCLYVIQCSHSRNPISTRKTQNNTLEKTQYGCEKFVT